MDSLYENIEVQSSLVLKKSNILYVESDEKLFSTMNSLFDYVFKTTYSTTNLKQALEIYKNPNNKIDLILIDMHIEEHTGIDLVKEIREIDEEIIVVISILPFNEGSEEDYIERSNNFYDLIKLRINDLLQKPYQPMTTLKVLSKHLVAKENEKLIQNQKNALANLKYIIDHQNLLSETDLEGNITYANDIFCKISGYTKSELVGNKHNIVRHPDMDKKVFKELWETIKSGKIWRGRIKNKKKTGEYYWVDAIIAPIIENDKIVKYMASRQEITELVDKEKQMRSEIKRIKSENYRDREQISKKAYDEGIQRYVKEFDDLKFQINLLKEKLKKAEAKNITNNAQIDKLIESEKDARMKKDKILSKAKGDISSLFDKTKALEKENAKLQRKLEDTENRYSSLQNSLKEI